MMVNDDNQKLQNPISPKLKSVSPSPKSQTLSPFAEDMVRQGFQE